MRRPSALFAAASLSALLLSACATHEVDYQGEGDGVIGAGVRVQATLETPSVGTGGGEDAADDPAIWVGERPVVVMGKTTPGFVAGTDKKAGLYIYGFDGSVLQFMPEGLLNNVDAVDLSVSGRSQVVLGASDRTPGRTGVSLYIFDPTGTGQNGVRPWGAIQTDVVEPYGFCFGRRGDEVHAILVGHEGEVRQFVLSADANGRPVSREVRRFEIGSISEGCAADAETGALYLAEENVGVWRYGLDPASGDARTLIQGIETDRLVADAEGLTILADGEARYLINSSQGDSAFPVWRIDGAAPVYMGWFVVEDGVVDGVTGTDGLAALGGRVSDAFPEGLVVVQDDVNDVGTQNFKYIDWRVIKAALGID
ncbi:phytase [Brevundimonas staleyi]|uniref:Phytase n=1 Tax=Brevundimonas staleyi TaxID=74326 RepID=A0ABW0FR71_9CAUL